MTTVKESWPSVGVGPNVPSMVFAPATAVNVGPGFGKSGGSPPRVPPNAGDAMEMLIAAASDPAPPMPSSTRRPLWRDEPGLTTDVVPTVCSPCSRGRSLTSAGAFIDAPSANVLPGRTPGRGILCRPSVEALGRRPETASPNQRVLSCCSMMRRAICRRVCSSCAAARRSSPSACSRVQS